MTQIDSIPDYSRKQAKNRLRTVRIKKLADDCFVIRGHGIKPTPRSFITPEAAKYWCGIRGFVNFVEE